MSPRRRAAALATALVAALSALAVPALADDPAASALPPALRDVGIDQQVGATLPLDLPFRDDDGSAVRLRDVFGNQPVILMPVYYRCPMLCPLALEGVSRSLKVLTFGAQTDYRLVVFSFDPSETPADARRKKADALKFYGRSGAATGWHFLTGDAASIGALTKALGFRYAYDARLHQFVHASTLVLVSPQGKVSRYLYTTEPAPKDLRLGLVDASAGRLGTFADQVLLFCYHYDATTGRYTLLTMRLVRIAGVVTVLALAGFILFMLRQEKRGRLRAAEETT